MLCLPPFLPCTKAILLTELDPLAVEGGEGSGEIGVVEDELAVEVGEAQEGLDLLHRLGGRPL